MRGFSLGRSPTEYRHNAWYGKTRMVWLHDGEKVWRYEYSFWYNTRTWQTAGRTDRRTDRYFTRSSLRGKNWYFWPISLYCVLSTVRPSVFARRCYVGLNVVYSWEVSGFSAVCMTVSWLMHTNKLFSSANPSTDKNDVDARCYHRLRPDQLVYNTIWPLWRFTDALRIVVTVHAGKL